MLDISLFSYLDVMTAPHLVTETTSPHRELYLAAQWPEHLTQPHQHHHSVATFTEHRPPGHTRGGRHQPRHVLRAHELVAEAEGGRDGGQLARVRLRLAHPVILVP